MRKPLILLLIAAAAIMTACDSTPRVSDRNLQSIDYDSLQTMISESTSKKPTVLVDVRSADEYRTGFIPGAVNITLPDMRAEDPRLTEAENIVVYGEGHGDALTPAAAKRLFSLGYENVYTFRGGIDIWKKLSGNLGTAE